MDSQKVFIFAENILSAMLLPKWINPANWLAHKRERQASGADGSTAQAVSPRAGGSYFDFSLLDASCGSPSALRVAAVYRCVNLLADSVAVLPLQYMRRKGGRFEVDANSRLHYLLTIQPDSYLSAFDFWRLVVTLLLVDGNAYIVPVYNRASAEIERLALCGRHSVSHDATNDTYSVCDAQNGIYGTYTEANIIHLKWMSLDGKTGLSVLSYARLTSNIAAAGDAETLNRFANGGSVRGLVGNDRSVRGFGEYQDGQLAKTAEDIDTKFRSGERIVSLPGQVDFKQISLSSTDMQFLESRKFSVREVCRFFGVHPSFVFDDTSNNYKSAEMANVAFLNNTLNPILRKIEAELLRSSYRRRLHSSAVLSSTAAASTLATSTREAGIGRMQSPPACIPLTSFARRRIARR